MRNPDTITADLDERRIVHGWTLDTPPLSGNANVTPVIELTVAHYKNGRAYSAQLSYVEREQHAGYSMTHWQTDWPGIRLIDARADRYSAKRLREIAEQALAMLDDEAVLATTVGRMLTPEQVGA